MVPSKQRFLWTWVVSFATLTGFVSAIVVLLPQFEFDVPRSLLLLVACISVSFAYAWRGFIRPHLPLEELERVPLCRLQCPANRSLMLQAHELAADSYERVDPIDCERYEQWMLKNPNVLVCLVDGNDMVTGYFDLFPITDAFAEALMQGATSEHDMRREHIIAPNEIHTCKWLYLGGIAVKDREKFYARRRVPYLVWGLKMYLRAFYPAFPDKILIATGASAEGERLLHRFCFKLRQTKSARADKQNLYTVSLSDKAFQKELAELPDFRSCCRITWRLRRNPRSKPRFQT